MIIARATAVFVLWLSFIGSAAATLLQGEVIRVLDGDTVELLDTSKNTYRIRLANIDAPEKSQSFSEVSRQALASFVFRKPTTVHKQGVDRYGRVIGVLVVDGVNVNAQMVHQGLAWVYTQYNKDSTLVELQQDAKARKAGLWTDPDPIAPWDYRARRSKQ